jgi:16S rRNA (guanine527-N7)-methyltransferase
MEQKDFLRTLLTLTEDYGIPFSEGQAVMCHGHVVLMLDWNRRCNLTRITDLKEIIEKHLLDSLIPARWLPQTGSAIDIGSGPGFPGIPLKILQPALEMVLLESHRKKVSFLKVVLSKLLLQNIRALQGRWEEFAQRDCTLSKNPFKLATMRAIRLEPEHVYAAGKILERDGMLAWWAGSGADLGWHDKHRGAFEKAGMIFEGRYTYSLPSATQPRYLLTWRKR